MRRSQLIFLSLSSLASYLGYCADYTCNIILYGILCTTLNYLNEVDQFGLRLSVMTLNDTKKLRRRRIDKTVDYGITQEEI